MQVAERDNNSNRFRTFRPAIFFPKSRGSRSKKLLLKKNIDTSAITVWLLEIQEVDTDESSSLAKN